MTKVVDIGEVVLGEHHYKVVHLDVVGEPGGIYYLIPKDTKTNKYPAHDNQYVAYTNAEYLVNPTSPNFVRHKTKSKYSRFNRSASPELLRLINNDQALRSVMES